MEKDPENSCKSCVLRTKFKLNGDVMHIVQTEDEQLDDNYLLLGSREHFEAIEQSISNVQAKIRMLQERIAHGEVDQLQLENCIAKLQKCEAQQLEEFDFLREHCAPVVQNPSSDLSDLSFGDDTLNRSTLDFDEEETLSVTDTSEEIIHVTSTTFGAIKKLEIIEIKKREGLYVPPVIRQYFKNGILHRENEHMHVAWVELFVDLIYVGAISKTGYVIADKYSWDSFLNLLLLLNPIFSHWRMITTFNNIVYQEDVLKKIFAFINTCCIIVMTISIQNAFDLNPAVNTANWLIGAYVGSAIFINLYLYCFSFISLGIFRRHILIKGICEIILLWPYFVEFFYPADNTLNRYQYRRIFWGLGILFDNLKTPITVAIGELFNATELRFGLNIEHYTERHGLLVVIVLGEIVVNVQKNFSNDYPGSFIALTVVAFLMTYNIYYIYFRAEIGDHSKHALRRNKYTGILWGAIHVLLALTMVSLAKCLSGLLSEATNSYVMPQTQSQFNYEFQTLYTGSLAIIYILISILSISHLDKSEVSHTSKKKIKFIRNLSKMFLVVARIVVGLLFLILGLTLDLSAASWIYVGGGLTTVSLFLEEYVKILAKMQCAIRTKIKYNGKLIHVVKTDEERSETVGHTVVIGSLEHIYIVSNQIIQTRTKIDEYRNKISVASDHENVVLQGQLTDLESRLEFLKMETQFLNSNKELPDEPADSQISEDHYSIDSTSEDIIHVTTEEYGHMQSLQFIDIPKRSGILKAPIARQYIKDGVFYRESDPLRLPLFVDLVYIGAMLQAAKAMISNYSWEGFLHMWLIVQPIIHQWRGYMYIRNIIYHEDLVQKLFTLLNLSLVFSMSVFIQNAFSLDKDENTGNGFVIAYLFSFVIQRSYLFGSSFFSLSRFRQTIVVSGLVQSLLLFPYILVLFYIPDGTLDIYQSRLSIWILGVAADTISFFISTLINKSIPSISVRFGINVEHYCERHGLFLVIVLGQVAISFQSGFHSQGGFADFFGYSIASLVLIYNLFFMYFRAEVAYHQKHALQRHLITGFLWEVCHAYLTVAAIGISAGICYYLQFAQSSQLAAGDYQAQTVYIFNLAGFFVIISILGILHVDLEKNRKTAHHLRVFAKLFAGIFVLFFGIVVSQGPGLIIMFSMVVSVAAVVFEEFGRLIKPAIAAMEEHSAKIAGLKAKLDAMNIPAKEQNNPLVAKKQEAKAKFDTLLKQKQDINAKKSAILNTIKGLQDGLKKKGDDLKQTKDRLGFKTTEEIDRQVIALEKQLEKGVSTLMEEKKIVAEISSLKKAKKTLQDLSSGPSVFETDKAKLDSLREQLNGLSAEIKKIDPQVTEAKKALEAAQKEVKETFSSINALVAQKSTIQKGLASAKEEKAALYTSFKAQQESYYAWERIQRQKRAEEEKLKRDAEKEERLVAQAERELEEADIAAFSGEIALCDALIKFFKAQLPAAAAQAAETTNEANSEKIGSSAPPRATVLVRKEDRDEDFLCLGGKKNKSKKRASAVKTLKMDIEVLGQLAQLSIAPPKNTTEVATAIEALEQKKVYFHENSASQTAANKAAALAKVQKLRENKAETPAE
ncbi:hypothetical protein HDV01_005439 [Terramyces sp. JEL0728]|nr:hypothetical protein HDV01_005439 [Terramyces sp. JEL0728]